MALNDGGADHTFNCTGSTGVMPTALENCHRVWGEGIIIGVAEAGRENSTRPFQRVMDRIWMRSAFGGAPDRTVMPEIVDLHMESRIEANPTHTHTLDKPNKGRDLMPASERLRSVVVY